MKLIRLPRINRPVELADSQLRTSFEIVGDFDREGHFRVHVCADENGLPLPKYTYTLMLSTDEAGQLSKRLAEFLEKMDG